MDSLKGKVALITGVSHNGIGAQTGRRLAALGASLYLSNDDPAPLTEVAESCLAAGAERVETGAFDFTARGRAEAMVEAALKALGRVDILVNNAAVRIRHPFGAFTNEEFDDSFAVLVRAPMFASQAVLPAMRRQGGGRIIHVASQMGLVAEPGSTLYGLGKAALIHLTKSMAVELVKDNIIVNAVSPGPIMTEYNEARTSKDPELKKRKLAYVPAGRYGRTEEVAEVVAFLATTPATYILGHNLVMDGGYVIH